MRSFLCIILTMLLLAGCVSSAVPTKPGITEQNPSSQPSESTGQSIPTLPSVPTEPVQPSMPTEPVQPTQPSTQPTQPSTQPTPPVSADVPADDAFVCVSQYIPDVLTDLKYATDDNFVGQPVYAFTQVYLRYGTVKKLMVVQEKLREQGLSLKIWDGYRPVYAQWRLWEAFPNPTYVSNPSKGASSHSKGNTVDVTVVDAQGQELVMPTGFDDFTKLADRDYSDCSSEAAENALLLQQLMYDAGFKGYSAEWWHYTDQTDYAVEKVFDPSVVSLWYTNVNEYLSMRTGPKASASLITRIPKGATVTLLGWTEKFAYVSYGGKWGYVMSNYLLPVETPYWALDLDIEITDCYTYEDMMGDLQRLAAEYPQQLTLSVIGSSEQGTPIPVAVVGNPEATNQILIHASIHGREHMTTHIVMAMLEMWLDSGAYNQWDVCYHIIPMVNPDGVAVSQNATLNALQKGIYQRDVALGYTKDRMKSYAQQWKANALGIDINRCFDANWGSPEGRTEPSSEKYAGSAPLAAVEAQALQTYTVSYDFDLTISYHAYGSIMYPTWGTKDKANKLSMQLATDLRYLTGYPIIDAKSTDGGGYGDWCGDQLGIPSIAFEIGCSSSPLALREVWSLLARNRQVMAELARWVKFQNT